MTETLSVQVCERCGVSLPPTTPNNQAKRRYCGDKCRYEAWKARKFAELQGLMRQLAGRV